MFITVAISSAAALLGLLIVDVFLTVFDAKGRGGPLNRLQNKFIWTLFRTAGSSHPAVLSLAAPLMAVVTLVGWVVLLIASFALAFYPFIGNFLVSPGQLREPWVEAIYFSGYTASTLGFGDLVPDSPALRLLVPLEAFLGFALLSLSVTYLLAVYRELLLMQSLSVVISLHFEAGLAEKVKDDPAGADIAVFAEEGCTSLTRSMQAHYHYPILHYFRPVDEQRALPVQLHRLVERLPAVERGSDQQGLSLGAFSASIAAYLRMVDEDFLPKGFAADLAGQGTEIQRADAKLLRYMLYR